MEGMETGSVAEEPQESPRLGGDTGGSEAGSSAASEAGRVRVRSLVAALRSGKYVQTHGALQVVEHPTKAPGFCCLGVACEVAVADGLEVGIKTAAEERTGNVYVWYDEEMSLLPNAVRRWYGLADDNPDLKVPAEVGNEADDEAFQRQWQEDPDERVAATELNDDYGFTFPQIADCFEYTLLPEDWEVTRASR